MSLHVDEKFKHSSMQTKERKLLPFVRNKLDYINLNKIPYWTIECHFGSFFSTWGKEVIFIHLVENEYGNVICCFSVFDKYVKWYNGDVL